MSKTSSIERTKHEWASDEAYVRAQANDSSWSHTSAWGSVAAKKFVGYGRQLSVDGVLYHDDVVADFGGNDGTCANAFYLAHAIKPLVVDCEPERLEYAATVYGLTTLQCFIEDIPLPDNAIDWGFTSHTLEHTRDPEKAVRELARVIKRGCFFVLPMEDKEHSDVNEAHSIHCDTLKGWTDLLKANGWTVKRGKKMSDGSRLAREAQIMAVPRA